MIIEIGHFALVLAFALSLVQAAVCWRGAALDKQAWMMAGRQCAISVCGLVLIGLVALVYAYALSDFSVLNVATNSHTMKPLLYKIAAVWGNHEGSMVLWLWMMTAWAYVLVRGGKNVPFALQARVLGVQGALTAGFALFILAASNPFIRLVPPAPEGLDLNPVLQDPLLAIHPPMLYAGYVGFSLSFSFAVAALLARKVDAAWARLLRPYVLSAWVFLTAGIALGSFWAYYELGWGGFWFWDPVENASLMPWLAATALLHCVTVMERRDALRGWTVLLALLTFILSLLGTFLVRSGVLTSVHAFAADPARGIFILCLLSLVAGGALFLYAYRAPEMKAGSPYAPLSREMALLLNNVFLSSFLATVFIGVVYPIMLAALDLSSVSVGAPYYVAVLTPMLLPFAALMGAAPALAWRRAQIDHLKKLSLPLLVTGTALLSIFMLPVEKTALGFIGMAAGVWIVAATFHDLLRKSKQVRVPLSYFGMVFAHIGFGILVIGATAATQWAQEKVLWMQPGMRTPVAGYHILLIGTEEGIGTNYNADRALFTAQVMSDPSNIFFLTPEKRWYPVQEKETSESALAFRGFDVLYVVLGDRDVKNEKRWVVRIYHHPLVMLVFAGAGLIALGGLLSAFDRRRKAEDVA